MTNGVMHLGTILTGDLDLWTFTANNGDDLVVRMGQITDTNTFYTWVRLYGPDGALLQSLSGSATAQINLIAANSGTFIAVVSDGNGALSGIGTYRLTSNGLLAGLRLCPPIISGTNVNLGGVGGVSNATYILYTHTDVVAPAASWAPIRTNQFDPFGTFHYTNVFNPSGVARHFYLLEQL